MRARWRRACSRTPISHPSRRREWGIVQPDPVSAFVCDAFCLFIFTQPPTVLNPQNYSYLNVKGKPGALAVPTAGAQAAPFSSAALINATWLRRSRLGSVSACVHMRGHISQQIKVIWLSVHHCCLLGGWLRGMSSLYRKRCVL